MSATLDCKNAAKELLARRKVNTKAPRLESHQRPNSLDDALQIQAAMVETSDDTVGGWKCLQPLAENKFVVAPIFASTIQTGDVCRLFADNNTARIEPEIAFKLIKSLPANDLGYNEEEINDAIGSCHMALELIQSRYADDSGAEFYDVLADGLANQGLFIGPEIVREKAFAASSVDIMICQGDSEQTFLGTHPNTQPASPIYWLINEMSRRGVSFHAGEAIITGSYCGVVNVNFDVSTKVNYEGLGQYQVRFTQINN